MHIGRVYSPEEIAEHFGVPLEIINEEIEKGALTAMRIGPFLRISADAVDAYVKRPADVPRTVATNHSWRSIPPFNHTWPDNETEHYDEAYACTLRDPSGRQREVKIGFTNRMAAEKDRRRAVVFIGPYPAVEFVAANNFETTGKMASIIKDDKKHIPLGGTLPAGYENLKIVRYRDIVDGSYASSGSAVLALKDDLDTMALHGMLRYLSRE